VCVCLCVCGLLTHPAGSIYLMYLYNRIIVCVWVHECVNSLHVSHAAAISMTITTTRDKHTHTLSLTHTHTHTRSLSHHHYLLPLFFYLFLYFSACQALFLSSTFLSLPSSSVYFSPLYPNPPVNIKKEFLKGVK